MIQKLTSVIQTNRSISGNKLFTGSVIFFVSTTIVHLGNYFYNLVLGRWLGPAKFSDLSIIITLFLIVLFITATIQMIAARYSAISTSDNDYESIISLRKILLQWAWGLGLAFTAVFGFGAPLWQRFFHTQSYLPFVIFGIGLPFYLAQSVDRGILQGQTRFSELAVSYQVEMWVRLLAGIGLVAIGGGVVGAAGGLTLSFIATWLFARRARFGLPEPRHTQSIEHKKLLMFSGWVSISYLSQILINNSDIIVIKHFFPPDEAGQYAALALIGRVVFFITWSVVTTLFPIVAQRHQNGQTHRHLLGVGLLLVLVASVGVITITYYFPNLIVGVLFGQAYLEIAPFLWLYAVATSLYALANVIVNYHLSIGIGKTTIMALSAGILQVFCLWYWHDSLQQVVIIQIILMAGLLFILLVRASWLIIKEKLQSNDFRQLLAYHKKRMITQPIKRGS